METAYFDTSALVKRYVAEEGSQWIKTLCAPPNNLIVCTSQMTVVETACAFSRRMREGALSSEDYKKLLPGGPMVIFGIDKLNCTGLCVELAAEAAAGPGPFVFSASDRCVCVCVSPVH